LVIYFQQAKSDQMTSTYRPNESKREEFRRYLEKGGVVDAITRLFFHLFSSAFRVFDYFF
jgi:hypothetical protein